MGTIRRLYFAIVAFVALVAASWGAIELVAVLARAALDPQAEIVQGQFYWREQVAWAAATLIIALPVWVVHWRAMQSAARRHHEEAVSVVFRFYILLVLSVAALSTLFLTITLVRTVLLRVAGLSSSGDLESLVRALGWVVAWGVLWYYHAPYAAPSAPGMADSTLRRWYLYIVSAVAAGAFVSGAFSLAQWVIGRAITPDESILIGAGRDFALRRVISDTPWILFGGLWWHWFFQRQAASDKGSLLRQVYLYGAMAIAIIAALTGLGAMLYELLRFLFGYRASTPETQLRFLTDAVPLVLLGVPGWLYHRSVTREEDTSATPLRVHRYVVSAAGLSLVATGLGALLYLFLDFAFGTFPEFQGSDWWRDQLSFALTSALIGLPLWAMMWSQAQRAASDTDEVVAMPRRAYLFIVLLVAVLAMLGFGVAALYQALQIVLGAPVTADGLRDLFSAFGFALIAAGVLAYHGMIARREMGVTVARPAATPTRHRVLILTTPDLREGAETLARTVAGTVEVRTLAANGAQPGPDELTPPGIPDDVAEAIRNAPTERVLVMLRRGGADVYPYE